MRRLVILALILLGAAHAVAPPAEQSFDLAMQALAKSEWDHGLDLLETALSIEPDNLRYGSEYRQAVLRHAVTIHPKEGQVQDFERSLKFFDQLVAKNPGASNAYLNYGFAYV